MRVTSVDLTTALIEFATAYGAWLESTRATHAATWTAMARAEDWLCEVAYLLRASDARQLVVRTMALRKSAMNERSGLPEFGAAQKRWFAACDAVCALVSVSTAVAA